MRITYYPLSQPPLSFRYISFWWFCCCLFILYLPSTVLNNGTAKTETLSQPSSLLQMSKGNRLTVSGPQGMETGTVQSTRLWNFPHRERRKAEAMELPKQRGRKGQRRRENSETGPPVVLAGTVIGILLCVGSGGELRRPGDRKRLVEGPIR